MQTPFGRYFRYSYQEKFPERADGLSRYKKICYRDAEVNPQMIMLDGYFQMSESDLWTLKHKTSALSRAGIGVARLIDYEVKDDADERWPSGYMIYHEAYGMPVKIINDHLGVAAEGAIAKLVHDVAVVRENGLVVDYGGANLHFCHNKDRFTLIDLIPADNIKDYVKSFQQRPVAHFPDAEKFYGGFEVCADTDLFTIVMILLTGGQIGFIPKELTDKIRHYIEILPELKKKYAAEHIAWLDANRDNYTNTQKDRIDEFQKWERYMIGKYELPMFKKVMQNAARGNFGHTNR
ncbi:MAG: hypothetical protein FWC83_00355 [Alphaproteobacteria bacterium]|nr:hypothetical protein [Alphaproteobacteria bacterium]